MTSMVRADPQHTGRLSNHIGRPRVRFITRLGAHALGSPVSDGMSVFALWFEGTDAYVSAVDLSSGTEKWRNPVGYYPSCSWLTVAMYAGFVYVPDHESLVALDARTGKERKRVSMDSGWGPTASPTVVDGKLLICSNLGCLHAFDHMTLQEVWRASASPNLLLSAPACEDDRVFVASCASSPRCPGELLCVRLDTGRELWRFVLPDLVRTSASVEQGIVYVLAGWSRHSVIALDAEFGRVLWDTAIAVPSRSAKPILNVESSVALSAECVFANSLDGRLVALDKRTGKAIWSVHTQDGLEAAPAVGPDLVYLGTNGGRFLAFEKSTGEVRWEVAVRSPILASPCDASRGLCLTSIDGHMYFLDENELPDKPIGLRSEQSTFGEMHATD